MELLTPHKQFFSGQISFPSISKIKNLIVSLKKISIFYLN